MPSDIRSFFGGKPPAAASPTPEKVQKTAPKKGRGSRKVVEDSDEEDFAPPPKKATPVKARRAPSPEGEATTSSEYFGKAKPKRSEPVRPATEKKTNGATPVKPNGTTSNTAKTRTPVKTPSKATPSRSSGRKKTQASYTEDFNEDDFPDDLELDDEPAMAKAQASSNKAATASRNSTAKSTPAKSSTSSKRGGRTRKKDDDDYDEDDDVHMGDANDDDLEVEEPKPAKTTKSAGTKRKAKDLDEDDEDETPQKKKSRTPAKKKQPEAVEDSAEIKAILADIPLVRAPTPPPKTDGKYEFKFGQGNKNLATPAAAGTKEKPVGADNCLAGLSFVVTGQLPTLQRDEATSLIKQYGGKLVGAPSKNTSFVVLGTDAGPKKLAIIQEHKLKTIDEDGLFALIRKLPANGGDSKAAAANAEKKAKEDEKIRKAAAAEEKAEKQEAVKSGRSTGPDSRLWTSKYAPTALNQLVGNKTAVEKLQRWLRNFQKNARTNFKLPGPDGTGTWRAVIIHGPPGIGKTTAAHLVAKLEGFDIVESNASDTRSKKLVESGLKSVLDTTSLAGYFAGGTAKVEASKRKLCLIMDEVDGMSAGDRGGVGAMAAVIKKTHVPIILICNDRRQQKMKPFDHVAYDMKFTRPTAQTITSRIRTIMHREKLSIPDTALNALVEGTNADIRQAINMISTAKLDDASMSFADGKAMSKAWEKHVILKPWDIVGKILGGNMFGGSSKATLNEKSELYFNDHELSFLMLQENYLNPTPALLSTGINANLAKLKNLQLASRAADSISDGDLVDRMIHGSQQQWSLMPAHAIFSFVRPASYRYGNLGYSDRARFPSWLGQNSAQGKLTRLVKEIQGHMRLRMTGDRHDVRQQYLPLLWKELVWRLQEEGKEAVDEIIELMDSYYLTKDDFDAIMELGVGPYRQDKIKIESQDKAAFTREYNKRDHPLPFMKASSVTAPKKLSKDKPDLEEAIEEDDEDELINVKEEDEEEDMDLSKDKYVKQPKKKKAAAPAKAKGAKKAKGGDEDGESDEDVKPKKGKGKAVAKGRAKK